MWLKFIGEDGSLGLVHGEHYYVKIRSDMNLIKVSWISGECHYSNIKKFTENWSD